MEGDSKTVRAVISYTISYILIEFIYCLPRFLAEIGVDVSHINENFTFPLSTFTYGLLFICCGFASLDSGERTVSKIRLFGKEKTVDNSLIVLIILFAVLAETWAFNIFLGHTLDIEYSSWTQVFNGIDLPVGETILVVVATFCFYVDGAILKRFKDKFNLPFKGEK